MRDIITWSLAVYSVWAGGFLGMAIVACSIDVREWPIWLRVLLILWSFLIGYVAIKISLKN